MQTNFLDVTFNLKSKKYWSFREPNDQPLYIYMQSNQPPVIKKQLLSMLSNWYLSFRETRRNLPKPSLNTRRRCAKANMLEDYNVLTTQAPAKDKENETSCGLIPRTTSPSKLTSHTSSSAYSLNIFHLTIVCMESGKKQSQSEL